MTDLGRVARMRDEYVAAARRKREREQQRAAVWAGRPSRDDQIAALYRLWAHLPRVFRNVDLSRPDYSGYRTESICSAADANVITSEVQNSDLHAPVLDIDMGCALLPSSTPGHFHLLIEKPMTWRAYKRLLRSLRRAGILEDGFVRASLSRGYSSARVPWVKKHVG